MAPAMGLIELLYLMRYRCWFKDLIMNILVINGHPDLSKSVANATILADFAQHSGWHVNHVADFAGDIEEEQAALLRADLVVVQFPFYWSTYPSVLKRWVDETFTFGFAFGPEGSKLKGKPMLFSVTAGATEDSYSETGFNFQPFSAYQVAYEHPFRAAEVDIVDTIITFEMNATPEEGGDKAQTLALSHQHAQRVITAVNNVLEVSK